MIGTPELSAVFSTLLLRVDPPDAVGLQGPLTHQILTASRTLKPVMRGETAGWQSDNSFFDWSPETAQLRHWVATAVRQLHPSNSALEGMHLCAWANVLPAGAGFSPHDHPGGAWSGVYWVDAAESGPDHGGLLMLRDPRAGARMVESPTNAFDRATALAITPATGRLLLFPSWLVHWVTTYGGPTPRLSVSFNVW